MTVSSLIFSFGDDRKRVIIFLPLTITSGIYDLHYHNFHTFQPSEHPTHRHYLSPMGSAMGAM